MYCKGHRSDFSLFLVFVSNSLILYIAITCNFKRNSRLKEAIAEREMYKPGTPQLTRKFAELLFYFPFLEALLVLILCLFFFCIS